MLALPPRDGRALLRRAGDFGDITKSACRDVVPGVGNEASEDATAKCLGTLDQSSEQRVRVTRRRFGQL